jgi:hypothetical protein
VIVRNRKSKVETANESVHEFGMIEGDKKKNRSRSWGGSLGINPTIRFGMYEPEANRKSTCFEYPWSKRFNEQKGKIPMVARTISGPPRPGENLHVLPP